MLKGMRREIRMVVAEGERRRGLLMWRRERRVVGTGIREVRWRDEVWRVIRTSGAAVPCLAQKSDER